MPDAIKGGADSGQPTLVDRLLAQANRMPTEGAVVSDGESLTFKALVERAWSIGYLCLQRIELGSRVGLWLANRGTYVASLFGTLSVGAVAVPLPSDLSREEVDLYAEHLDLALVLTDRSGTQPGRRAARQALLCHVPSATNRADRPANSLEEGSRLARADEPAVIFLTSGSTGRPRGVVHSHRSLGARLLDLSAERLTWMTPLSLETMAGHTAMAQALLNGHRLIAFRSFHPRKAIETLLSERVNVLAASPSTLDLMTRVAAQRSVTFPHLRYIGLGGGPVTSEIVETATRTFGCAVVVAYGSTELGGPAFREVFAQGIAAPDGVAGRPVDGVDAMVVGETGREVPVGTVGELACRSDGLMRGYEDATANRHTNLPGSWFLTGDLAVMDESGVFRIVGRRDDVLIRGERKIHALELEHFLESLPNVSRAGVVGVSRGATGDEIWAFVTSDAGAIREEDLLPACRGALPSYKVPNRVRVCDQLPLTSDGKIRKAELRRWVRREQGADQL